MCALPSMVLVSAEEKGERLRVMTGEDKNERIRLMLLLNLG
jgi:hypothetical protein